MLSPEFPTAGEIVIWNSKDVRPLVDLQAAAFHDDVGYKFVLKTADQRDRWFYKFFTYMTRITVSNGYVTAIWDFKQPAELAAVALWFPPDRNFPPPWYRNFMHVLPLLPLILEPSVGARSQQLNRCYLSLMPKGRSIRLLAGLAVRSDCRKQGLATKLLQYGKRCATADGHPVFLQCWTALVPFYLRLGFGEISRSTLKGTGDTLHGLLWESNSSTAGEC